MPWGLDSLQLSYEQYAILMVVGSFSGVDDSIYEQLQDYSPRYDFYLDRDVNIDYLYDKSKNLTHTRAGDAFCNKIITKAGVAYNNMGELPSSAVQYCYNKNKRNADGTITQSWYLPAVDEIEEIVMSTYDKGAGYSYSRFPDFRSKNYWSCQPAYKNNIFYVKRNALGTRGDRWGWYMIDNTERARATSVSYNGQGASNPDNYSKKTSGMTGYFKWINGNYKEYFVTGYLENMNELDVKGDGTEKIDAENRKTSYSETLTKPVYDSCALKRTDYARVRCVRKQ